MTAFLTLKNCPIYWLIGALIAFYATPVSAQQYATLCNNCRSCKDPNLPVDCIGHCLNSCPKFGAQWETILDEINDSSNTGIQYEEAIRAPRKRVLRHKTPQDEQRSTAIKQPVGRKILDEESLNVMLPGQNQRKRPANTRKPKQKEQIRRDLQQKHNLQGKPNSGLRLNNRKNLVTQQDSQEDGNLHEELTIPIPRAKYHQGKGLNQRRIKVGRGQNHQSPEVRAQHGLTLDDLSKMFQRPLEIHEIQYSLKSAEIIEQAESPKAPTPAKIPKPAERNTETAFPELELSAELELSPSAEEPQLSSEMQTQRSVSEKPHQYLKVGPFKISLEEGTTISPIGFFDSSPATVMGKLKPVQKTSPILDNPKELQEDELQEFHIAQEQQTELEVATEIPQQQHRPNQQWRAKGRNHAAQKHDRTKLTAADNGVNEKTTDKNIYEFNGHGQSNEDSEELLEKSKQEVKVSQTQPTSKLFQPMDQQLRHIKTPPQEQVQPSFLQQRNMHQTHTDEAPNPPIQMTFSQQAAVTRWIQQLGLSGIQYNVEGATKTHPYKVELKPLKQTQNSITSTKSEISDYHKGSVDATISQRTQEKVKLSETVMHYLKEALAWIPLIS